MANDTPFVDLPTPPGDANQPLGDSLIRGWDHGSPVEGSEYLRATQYRDSINQRVRSRIQFLLQLRGDPAAYKSLQRKTLPLAESSPPYIEGD